jgi:Uma2 family endonuclease
MASGLIITPHMVRPTHLQLRTVEDLLHDLGDVPARRVLTQPPPGTATEADLLRLVEVEKILVEMVDGTLVEKLVGWNEGVVGMAIAGPLREFAKTHKLGVVAGADATLRMRGGNTRLPDAVFVAWSSMPGGRMPQESVPMLPPDLVVEVLSESNTRAEMSIKRREYFESGAKLVWEVDPVARTASIYRPANPDQADVRTEAQDLDGENVLPGFRLPLREVFAEIAPSAP